MLKPCFHSSATGRTLSAAYTSSTMDKERTVPRRFKDELHSRSFNAITEVLSLCHKTSHKSQYINKHWNMHNKASLLSEIL